MSNVFRFGLFMLALIFGITFMGCGGGSTNSADVESSSSTDVAGSSSADGDNSSSSSITGSSSSNTASSSSTSGANSSSSVAESSSSGTGEGSSSSSAVNSSSSSGTASSSSTGGANSSSTTVSSSSSARSSSSTAVSSSSSLAAALLSGAWASTNGDAITLNSDSTFSTSTNAVPTYQGTYSVSGLVLTLNIEEMYGLAFLQKVQSYDFGLVGGLLDLVLPALELVLGATWFTLSSLVDTVTNVIQGIPLAGDLLQPMLDLIDSLFTAQVWNYTVSGNTLTLQSGLITVVYTK